MPWIAQPSLATIVANVGPDTGRDHRSTMATVDAMAHRSSGLRFVANAVRSRAAHRAVDEAAASVLPALRVAHSVIIADAGTHRADLAVPPTLGAADVVVLVHRQTSASAGAATVRIERLVETVDVNGPGSTWVTYIDGRKLDVGRLWASEAELTSCDFASTDTPDFARRCQWMSVTENFSELH